MKHSPRVTVRKMWDRNDYGVWIGCEGPNGINHWAKPVEIVIDSSDDRGGFHLPDPTFRIPRPVAIQLFEQFVQELQQEGESATNTKQVMDAKNEHLKDLRGIVEKLFSIQQTNQPKGK